MDRKVTSFSTLATFLYATRTIHETHAALATVKWPFSWLVQFHTLFVFVSSLQYLQTCFHLHRFLKSTVNKKIKIMFSFHCLSYVCLLRFSHTFPAPYLLMWYFSKEASVQVSPFTKSQEALRYGQNIFFSSWLSFN